ncbi:type IV prepilin, MshO [Photobacterium rosenbergii]|uniref:Type IV prepilin, MshO n=1 Tax=Photobacterium rosenbergii TaxID=294936 RepID=A0A2T3N8J6_9GAMM|nr:prepilin-type N-terminal cleavage/methylation domain-containing protein [Photobacterium rosenbergii]PSW09606.1 type IV prepilin, MshO [Photobacterium rosenbergii]
MARFNSKKASIGFTLMEMVISLVILGIIALAIGSYLQLGAEGYVSTVSRDRVQSQARFTLEKMTREIRHAAPNSLATTGSCISFYPIHLAGFTLGDARTTNVELVPTIGDELDWQAITSNNKLALAVGLGNSAEYAAKPFKINRVTAGPDGNNTVLVNVSAPLENRSPANRAYAYGQPVSFCLEANVLRRNSGNSSAVIAEQVLSFDVAVNGKGLENNSMVHLGLIFQDSRTGENFSYEHTVQVINVL